MSRLGFWNMNICPCVIDIELSVLFSSSLLSLLKKGIEDQCISKIFLKSSTVPVGTHKQCLVFRSAFFLFLKMYLLV